MREISKRLQFIGSLKRFHVFRCIFFVSRSIYFFLHVFENKLLRFRKCDNSVRLHTRIVREINRRFIWILIELKLTVQINFQWLTCLKKKKKKKINRVSIIFTNCIQIYCIRSVNFDSTKTGVRWNSGSRWPTRGLRI